MWLLFLHDMRSDKPGEVKAVCRAESKVDLVNLICRETVAPYADFKDEYPGGGPGTWHKSFRKGGPLEWCDPPDPAYERGHYKHMQPVDDVVKQQVAAAAKQIEEQIRTHYKNLVTDIKLVSEL